MAQEAAKASSEAKAKVPPLGGTGAKACSAEPPLGGTACTVPKTNFVPDGWEPHAKLGKSYPLTEESNQTFQNLLVSHFAWNQVASPYTKGDGTITLGLTHLTKPHGYEGIPMKIDHSLSKTDDQTIAQRVLTMHINQ